MFMQGIKGKKRSLRSGMEGVLEGHLPVRQLRMVQVWVDIHRDDLMLDWSLAVAGEQPFRIAPLQ